MAYAMQRHISLKKEKSEKKYDTLQRFRIS